MADNEEIRSTPQKDDNSDKPLTDEQEEALSRIMSDLEEDHKKEEAVPNDNETPSSNSLEEKDSDGLTDAQEAALERIMAEIEATSTPKSDEEVPDKSITKDQDEALNKIVAELQGDNSEKESETPELEASDLETSDEMEKETEIEPDSNETGSEDLTPEQEETLQKIISEIDDSSPQNDDSNENDPEKSSQQSNPEPEKQTETKENTSTDSDSEQLDLSDFESELQKVVAEAKTESVATAEAKREPLKEQKPPHTPKSDTSKKTKTTQVEKDTQEKSVESSSDSKKTTPAPKEKASEETQPKKNRIKESGTKIHPPSEKKMESPTSSELNQDQQKIAIPKPKELKSDKKEPEKIRTKVTLLEKIPTLLFRSNNKPGLKKVIIWGGTVIAVLLIVITTIRWFTSISGKGVDKALTVIDETNTTDSTDQNTTESRPSDSFNSSDLRQNQNNALSKILSEIATLRSFLLNKLKEIDDLKIYYKQGLLEVEEELIDLIRVKKLTILKKALSDQKIELGLRTIQRRKGYITKLDFPFNQAFKASEELFYLERKATILHELMESTSGISLEPFEKQVDESIRRISLIKENLNINQSTSPKVSLEIIWKDLSTKAQSNNKSASPTLTRQNKIIWKEICSGNFDRKWALTDLNEKTANCLLKWNGKDLYLNQLKTLTPKAAQILSQWSGEWLGLNGLSTLPSEVARHLASWKGRRLSLNGLSELSPKATRYLSKWQGDQLELIGLKHMGQWENPKTELFVSDKLRRQIPK
jgi:hypothetical protein